MCIKRCFKIWFSALNLTPIIFLSCKVNSESTLESVAPEKEKVAIYVFDGTNVKKSDNTILKQFHDRAVAASKHYYEGTNLFGTTMLEPDFENKNNPRFENIVQSGLIQLCSDVHKINPKYVFLAGYSRGSIEALTIAARAEAFCGKPVPFRWIGLVDTVNADVESLPSEVPPAREIACIHVFKDPPWALGVNTKEVPFCSTRAPLKGLNHHDFVASKETLSLLINSAVKASRGTLKFTATPNSTGSISEHTPTLPMEKPTAWPASRKPTTKICAQKYSGIECLKLGCEWDLSNGECSPVHLRGQSHFLNTPL